MRKISDFRAHVELHRHRVLRLGMALAESKFTGVNMQVLEIFLKCHDYSKAMANPEQLKAYGYTHSRTPVDRLFDFYGQTKKTPEQQFELRTVIQDINSIDNKIALEILEPLKLSKESLQSIYDIEKVADLVDRSLDPLAKEEFGHHMILASEFIQDPELARLSVWLEEHYTEITRDLSFLSFVKAL